MDLTVTEWILAAARAGAASAALWFAVAYSRVRWEDSPEGRNVMALSWCRIVVRASGAGRLVADSHPWIDLITAAAWLGVIVVLVWRHRLRRRVERDWDDTD